MSSHSCLTASLRRAPVFFWSSNKEWVTFSSSH